MDENKRGFHRSKQPDVGSGGSSSGGPPGGPRKGPKGPTNWNGPTAEQSNQRAADARIESFRNAHRSPELAPIVK